MIGEFKILEREFFKMLAEPGINIDIEKVNFNKLNLESMNKEIEKTQKEIKFLDKTIGNYRIQIKSKTEKSFYEKWTELINGLKNKFTEMFSAENDEIFKSTLTRKEKENILFGFSHDELLSIYYILYTGDQFWLSRA